ncbi:MAG: helix-turn-helix domain-containing protein [Sciscionella sp.]
MDTTEARRIGERVQVKRRRLGISLEVLAGLSGLDKGFLSRVENGKRLLDRRSHLVAVATALRTSPAELFGVPYPMDHPARSAAHDRVPAIRLAFLRSSLDRPMDVPVRPLPALAAQAGTVSELAQACDYDLCGQLLPTLLIELHVHVAAATDEPARTEALRLLADACHAAFMVTKSLGFADLAWLTAERHDHATKQLGDPVYMALSVFLRSHSLMPAGAHEEALSFSSPAADVLQPQIAGSEAAQLYGMHHLTCAFASAVLGDANQARSHVAEADEIAARVGEGEAHHLYFGPTNVGIWRTAIGVELGEGAKVAEYAAAINPGAVRSTGRRASLYADVGRGMAQERGKEREALAAIRQAEELAPQWVPTDPVLRDIVTGMLDRAKATAGGSDLTGLAWRMGIH